MTMSEQNDGDERVPAVVLDYLPHGRADDDRPQHQKPPLAYALGIEEFRMFEVTLEEDVSLTITDRFDADRSNDLVASLREIDYEDLSGAGQSELEHAIRDVVESNERRFVDFFNDAQPITLRLHQLNLLPGIGKKLRNNILEQRKRKPFESFEDLADRVSGLHSPKEVLVERILEELREEDLKYRTFVRVEEQQQ
jgi:putative nucleotide binding protein